MQGEFGRGWPYVLAAFIGIGGSFASLYFYSAGLFIKPLAAEFGWTRGEASLSALSVLLGSVLALPMAGRLIDRYGEVRVASASGLLFGISFVMLGRLTHGLASFLLLVLLLSMIATGANLIAYNRVIVRHFTVRRGLALGLAMTGTAIGAAFAPPVLTGVIAEHGWRAAYCVLGAMAVTLTGIATLMLRREPAGTARQRDASGAGWRVILAHPAFRSIAAIVFLAAMGVLGTTMHLVPMLTDGGMSLGTAGRAASLLGVSVLIGRVVTGHALDRFDAGWVAWLLLTAAAGGMLVLWSGDPSLILAGAVLVGFGLGTEADLLAYLLGRRFAMSDFGSAYGAILSVHAIGASAGGLLAGLSVDWTGGYGAWLLLAAAMLALSGLIALMTERGVVACQNDSTPPAQHLTNAASQRRR